MVSDPLGQEPCYIISVAARLVGVHPQTLRYYESAGLVKPCRSAGNRRLYSRADIERLLHIQRLTGEMGVNLAGVETILHLMEQMEKMRAEMEELHTRLRNEVALLANRLETDR